MAEQDSLSNFDFNKVSKPGKFLKWEAGKPVTVRILTKDPVVQERTFEGEEGINISTKFCFIVWNFTDERAQIMTASPSMARTFQSIGKDEDFGTNLQKCDIKISPEGEKLKRTYDINVLRHSGSEKPITNTMVDQAKELDLDKDVQDNKGRLSQYEPEGVKPGKKAETKEEGTDDIPPEEQDTVIEDIGDEPINLDDIPF